MSTTRRMDAAARSPWWLVASMVVLLAASQAVGTPRPLGTARGGAGVALSAPGGLGTIVGERATFPTRTRSLPPGASLVIVGFRPDVGGFTDVGGQYDRSMSYTFTPTRPFVIGEKLHIRLENSCTAFAYECIVS